MFVLLEYQLMSEQIALRIALGQINPTIGDVVGNADRIVAWATRARDALQADLIVFPELALTGYSAEDLLDRPRFMDACERELNGLRNRLSGIHALIGAPVRGAGGVLNAAVLLGDGRQRGVAFKGRLPNYGVFDERRHFVSAADPGAVLRVKGHSLGVVICEDAWRPEPIGRLARAGAALIVVINGSPFHQGKHHERRYAMAARVAEVGRPLVYLNRVGGQDELVFDGDSFVLDARGEPVHAQPMFEASLSVVPFVRHGQALAPLPGDVAPCPDAEAVVYRALVCGVRDYVEKNRFPGVLIGLSGGIDSALTLAIAADALGADRVEAVAMPSRYSAEISAIDAEAQARALGVAFRSIAIERPFQAFCDLLAPVFDDAVMGVAQENIQARCRAVILRALSNQSGRLVLTTGNKSELAVGYATLYGDMAGGFAPLKDCSKTWVYRLARYRNRIGPVIPERVITRPPSAELRPDQRDSDTLPDYDRLDGILERFVERQMSVDAIVADGYEREEVVWVVNKVTANEYKRRQAPPGVRVTVKAFGRDRRYPRSSHVNLQDW